MFSMVRQVLVLSAGCSAHLVAKADVGGGQNEEPDGEANENEIVHGAQNTKPRIARLIKYRAISIKKTLRREIRIVWLVISTPGGFGPFGLFINHSRSERKAGACSFQAESQDTNRTTIQR